MRVRLGMSEDDSSPVRNASEQNEEDWSECLGFYTNSDWSCSGLGMYPTPIRIVEVGSK